MKIMKTRTLFLALVALASITLSGCGNNTPSENPSAPTNSTGSQTIPGATNQNSGGNSGMDSNNTNDPVGTNH
jgi:predicted small lipoprotein YifL